MTTLGEPGAADALIARLEKLQPNSERRWGSMTPHEMLCHLADSFRGVLGEREVSGRSTWMSRHIVKFIAIHTPIPWPKGVPTMPEVNPRDKGTRPGDFARDRETVVSLMRRFVHRETRYTRHPMFGEMSRAEWLKWAFRHVDHHLRQFGV